MSAFEAAARKHVAESLLPSGRGVAIFDLDRTLVPGSSLVPLGRALVAEKLVTRRLLARNGLAALAFRRRGLSDERVGDVRSRLLHAVAGQDYARLAATTRAVGLAVGEEVFHGARLLVDLHVAAGDFCVILTAAPHELAVAVAEAIGAHRAVGTRLEVADGRFTGELSSVFCHGPGKLQRLTEEVGPIDWSAATAYGDSASDLPVLMRVGTPVAVNPDRSLRKAAAARGWPTIHLT
jgi:HAD superfamily hydrolase (TIGR01490 family)